MHPIRVAQLIYSHAIGGSEMCAMEIAAHLDRDRYDPVMVFMERRTGPMPGQLDRRSIPYLDLGRTRLTHLLWPVLPAVLLRRLKIDILHVHHLAFLRAIFPAVRLAGIRKVICTEHSKFELEHRPGLWNLIRPLPAKLDAFTVVSGELKAFFTQKNALPPEKITVIRNGVDINRFNPDSADGTLESLANGLAPGKTIVAVGRLTDAKDYPNLLTALKELITSGMALRLIIVGEGDLRTQLEQEIRSRGLDHNVFLAGTRTDVEKIIPDADAFALSSKHEGFPISLVEAMACGLPVVSTRVGGVGEIVVHEENGLIVEPGEPTALASALRRILDNAEEAKRMGTAARKTVEHDFSWTTIAGAYSSLYESVLR